MIRSRYRRIVFFFGRLLLGIAVWDLLLPRLGLRGWSERTRPERLRRGAAAFRRLAVQMGGVLIKVGQFLSTRVDVLPAAFTAELQGLQDEVPAAEFSAIRRLAEAELGAALEARYETFDPTPLAAASLGQVHLARLRPIAPERNGGSPHPSTPLDVAVKVLRPGIEALITTDLAALHTVGAWLERYRPIRRRVDVAGLLAEFTRTLLAETDYLSEGRNAETFAVNFAEYPGVRVPKVIWSHTTRRVLTLENVLSIKITDYEAIEAAGISRAEVASRLLDTYLKQIFEDGFFHADPHPGNLFVQPAPVGEPVGVGASAGQASPAPEPAAPGTKNGGRSFILTFVDFGMAGTVPDNLRRGLRELVIGVGTRDSHRVVGAYRMMDLLLPSADLALIERAEARVFERYWGKNMTELTSVSLDEMKSLASEFRDLVYEMPFQAPQNVIFLARCVAILSGMCTGLDPRFNVWDHLAPYARKLIAEETRRGREHWLGEVEKIARSLIAAPPRLEAMLARLESGDVAMRTPEVSRQVQRMESAQRQTTRAVVFAALLLGGIQLSLAGSQVFGGILIGAAGLTLLTMLIGLRPR